MNHYELAINRALGEKLRTAREKHKLTQEGLRTEISNYLENKVTSMGFTKKEYFLF